MNLCLENGQLIMKNTVAAQREGPGGPELPFIFRPKWGPKGRKKKFLRLPPPTTPPSPPSLQTLSTSSFSSINVTYLYRVFQNRQKISKGLNTSLVVSIVRTATSVTKMISRKYKLNSTYLKERCWFLAQPSEINLFLTRSRVVMFYLTIFWVHENSTSFFRTQK